MVGLLEFDLLFILYAAYYDKDLITFLLSSSFLKYVV